MSRRILCSVLALIFLLATGACAAGCSGKSGDTASATASAMTDTYTTAAETELSDELPNADYDGRAFRVACQIGAEYEIDVDELNGDIENDSIYERNSRIEDRFNIVIEDCPIDKGEQATYNAIVKTVLAGDDAYDLAGAEVWSFYIATSNGIYQNWKDTRYINYDKPWWNSDINEKATFNGKLLGLTGAYAITYLMYQSAIFFNMPVAADYGYTSDVLYDTVNSGEWTIDRLAETIRPIYADLNGDSKRDLGDRYGFTLPHPVAHDIWTTAVGQPITGKDENGKITIELLTEKTFTTLEKINAILNENEGGIKMQNDGVYENNKLFVNENVVFYPSFLNEAFTAFRDMDVAYGILPVPKYDEAQDEYHCLVVDGYSIWGLPMTVVDTDYISMITEALSADKFINVYPVYYDIAMKSKYSEDAATADMVDLIVSSGDFDISFMYGVYFEMLPYIFRQCVAVKSNDLMSKYTAVQAKIEANIETMYTFYE